MPALNYVSQTPQSVSVTYTDMPAGADVVFVNQVSGAQTPAQSGALGTGGSGSAEIPISGCIERPILLAGTKCPVSPSPKR